jgi:chemotaxis protein methyltransferase CheR
MLDIQPHQLDQLNALVHERAGLQIEAHRLPGVLQALRQAHVADFQEAIQALASSAIDSVLWQSLLSIITIGETYFFRNKSHLDALQYHILPPIIRQRRASEQKFLRIWSGGCATGEEPYSVAMLLREMIPDIDDWLITILATDINAASLDSAQRGMYTPNSFRNETRPHIKDMWFTAHGSRFELSPVIRRMVSFKLLNLANDDYPSYTTNTMNMDVVLCRNVTIYFDKAETQRVVKRLYQSMNQGGWLIVGHSEPQPTVYDAFQMVSLENAIFYRKPETPSPVSPVPAVVTQPPLTASVPTVLPEPAPSAKPDVLMQIKTAADSEQWDDALSLLTKHETEYRLHPYAHYLRAVIYMNNGFIDSVLAALRQSLYCNPQFVLARALMGDCYAQRKQNTEAQHHWRLALESLSKLEASALIPYTDDVTVEMLRELLNFRLKETLNALS